MLRRVFLAVFLVFGLVSAAAAERRVALVLAVEDYKAIRPLDNPVSDARAMETLLEGLGFEVYLETDRDLRRMRRALEDFREDAAGADLALAFFAGHGVAIEGVNYLLPVDADAASVQKLRDTSLPLAELQAVLAEVAPVSIILLDACRDDPFAEGATASADGRGAAALSEDPPETPRPVPGLGRIGRADGVLFAFAAAPGETASDGRGDNSPFTSALMRHFGTAGVELKSALTLVQQDVYDRSRGKQLPYIESGLPELVFISGQGEATERDQLLMAMAGLTTELRAEVEEVAQANDMPLAPLYGALIDGNLGDLPADQRRRKLEEAAQGYASFQSELVKYASDDPKVSELRTRAQEQLDLGLVDAALALLDEASTIDETSRVGLRENYLSRTLSQASTNVLSANAARSALRYDEAITDLARAVELYAEVQGDLTERETKLAYVIALQDLGYLYSVTGNSSAALSVQMTRADYTRALAMAEPFDLGWTREVVMALNAVGSVLQQQGYLREAEEEILKGLEFTRAQVVAHPEDQDLALSLVTLLNRLGMIQSMLGKLTLSLASHGEALEIAQRLLDGDPTWISFMRTVMITETSIGDVLRSMGNLSGARDSYDVALRISQQLTAEFPADLFFKQDLAVAYERLGDIMIDERDFDTALAIYLESVKLREELNAADPGNVELRRDFAVVWGKLGDIYSGLGDRGSALMAHEQARSINESLVTLDPSNIDWMVNLSITLERIGQIYHDEGEYAGALSVFMECRDVRERIITVDPSSHVRRREMGVVLEKIGNVFLAMGDLVSAEEVYVETLALRRGVAEADPTVTLYQEDLAWILLANGEVRRRQGIFDEARALIGEAVPLFDNVLATSEGLEFRYLNASVARNRLVEVMLAQGDGAAALPVAEQSVRLMEDLLLIRPQGDLIYIADMVVALQRLGDSQLMSDQADAADATFTRMVEAAALHAAGEPYSVLAEGNHAFALERLGDRKMAREDYAAARELFARAVGVRRWLAGQLAGSPWELRSLAVSLQKLADSHYFAGEQDPGRPIEEEALVLLRQVMAALPGDPWAVIDVVVGLDRVASYYGDPKPYFAEGLDLLEGLIAAGGLPDPSYQTYVDRYRDVLGR